MTTPLRPSSPAASNACRPIAPSSGLHRSTLRVALGLLAAASLAATPAGAQFGFPSPDQADMTLGARTRAEVVDSLAAALEERYVFADVGRKTAAELRARQRRGGFDAITSAKAFADTLTSVLRAVGKDKHFQIVYYERALPPGAFAEHGSSPEERARAAEQARRLNHGFEHLERLAGNVGYLELRAFVGTPEAGRLAQAAMTLLDGSDALIIDLRRNGGGDPNMIVMLLSWLFPADDRVHVNDFYFREGERHEQFWTLTTLPGPRYTGKDLFVLTSAHTGSAAEEFAYDIKNLKRGTLVGETTAGAANPGDLVRLGEHFAAFVSNGRAINPVSKTNWEGVGVAPDVAVDANEALKTAHVAALTNLIGRERDPERKSSLEHALQMAKEMPVEAGTGPRRVVHSGG